MKIIHPEPSPAEAARDQGKFAILHEALLTGGSLDDREIEGIARKADLDLPRFRAAWKGAAMRRVASDKGIAEAIGIDSTPSFVLCTPSGQTWRLGRLEQIHALLKE